MRVLPMGPTAALLDDLPVDPAAWSTALRSLDLPGVVDVVPAARTVLVSCSGPTALAGALVRLDDVEHLVAALEVGDAPVVVPVRYDGADLLEVAAATGMTPEEVVELHTGAEFRVAFCGFAPGFAYLAGLPAALHLPRRATPRTRVPVGSVAIAAEYSAVYPTASPGGWHLLGSTDEVMFDPDRSPPARLSPGGRVRFVPR